MKICLYGASSNDIPNIYIETVEKLGEIMAKRGHSLVFGGGANGLMGAAARGVTKGGGITLGIAPSFFNVDGILYDCSQMIYTETMRERKQIMEDNADAFVCTPGGVGTLDELFEIITLKQLARHKKPIAIFNIDGYYNGLKSMLENAVAQGFMTESSLGIAPFFETIEELLDYLENYKPQENDEILKNLGNK